MVVVVGVHGEREAILERIWGMARSGLEMSTWWRAGSP